MYPRTNIVMIGQVGIVILVLFSYPLQLHPARASLDKFLFPQRVPTSDDDDVDEHSDGDEIPLGRFVVESGALLFTTFLIAMFVSSLETVLGFVGATGSTTISFILPSVFCAYLSSETVRSFVCASASSRSSRSFGAVQRLRVAARSPVTVPRDAAPLVGSLCHGRLALVEHL
jgi:amino acid permease